ncbi:hypothetical protein, partial [Candidatus Amarolinea dominans]|uniref:hypothetical protein n=1 Tax=Candidatus Amarolinea dominans TaxID=3140696 RepID=UPI001DF80915|nr:hypothetical protein [Anaerolineae bacterium]
GLPLLVESAQALVVFDQQQLRPEPIFAAAEKGDVDAALRLLNVFDIDRDWRQAAQLLIAWLAVSKNKEATRKVRDQIVRETPALAQALDPTAYGPDPLRKMLGYLAAGLDDSPAPALDFPPTPYEHVVVAMVAAVESAEVDAEMLGRLQSGQIQYLAENDGLPLVAFAHRNPSHGDQCFDRYVEVLAGYGYREYRDKSLWWMLDAALFHPDQLWIQDRARLIVSSALAESKVRWRGSLPLTALALRAWMGEQKALDQFQAYIAKVAQDTEAIIANETLQQDIWGSLNETPQQDIWGSLRRCLAAIAEVQKQLLDLDLETKKYLELSEGLRRGFAGFKVPAYLNLAEAMCIGSLSTPGDMDSQIKDALLSAAHNIQDPVFCARSTARADAMIEQQWKTNRQGASVAQIIDGFIKDPFGRDFAALHRIGDGQKYARRQPNNRYPLPPEMRDDSRVTLSVLAKEVYRCPSLSCNA